MTEKLVGVHPLFDSSSLYGQMRVGLRAEGKMRGYFHWLWRCAKVEPDSWPAATERSAEELSRAARWVAEMAGETGRNGEEPSIRILDVWSAQATLLGPDPALTGALLPRGEIDLCLVREPDGKQTLGCRAPLFGAGWNGGSRCRAFLLEPEVVQRLQGLMGDNPWENAFLADNVAANYEVSQILAAAPEMEGIVGREDIQFERVPVPERYDALPPRKQPLQVVVVGDTTSKPASAAAPLFSTSRV